MSLLFQYSEVSTFDLGGSSAQAPIVSISGQTGLNSTVCSGTNVTLNVSAQNGLQNSYFVWERKDDANNNNQWTVLSGQSGSSFTTSNAGEYRVSEANSSCSSTSPVSSTVTIAVITEPVLSISSNSGSNTFCEGDILSISSSPTYSANQAELSGFTRSWFIKKGNSSPVQIPSSGLILDYALHDGANLYIQDEHQTIGCVANSSTLRLHFPLINNLPRLSCNITTVLMELSLYVLGLKPRLRLWEAHHYQIKPLPGSTILMRLGQTLKQ